VKRFSSFDHDHGIRRGRPAPRNPRPCGLAGRHAWQADCASRNRGAKKRAPGRRHPELLIVRGMWPAHPDVPRHGSPDAASLGISAIPIAPGLLCQP
jgi:hypothetical protein